MNPYKWFTGILSFSDKKLEESLAILVNSDIIEQGATNYDVQGVRDNIFDKLRRQVHENNELFKSFMKNIP